jgi:hypothetical protein
MSVSSSIPFHSGRKSLPMISPFHSFSDGGSEARPTGERHFLPVTCHQSPSPPASCQRSPESANLIVEIGGTGHGTRDLGTEKLAITPS